MIATLFDDKGRLRPRARQMVLGLFLAYILALAIMCFTPQKVLAGLETPGITYRGRLVFLLTPFNSLVRLGEVRSLLQLVFVIGQNLSNIFLLYPLIFLALLLWDRLAQVKKVLLVSFAISLFIETSQLILDALIDANRVFEVDDLWTNTLGGYLAYLTYKHLHSHLK